MDNITTIGICKWCKKRKKVNELITFDKGTQKVVLVCNSCLSNENRDIKQTIERREKNDDGTRYSHEEVMKMLSKRTNKDDTP